MKKREIAILALGASCIVTIIGLVVLLIGDAPSGIAEKYNELKSELDYWYSIHVKEAEIEQDDYTVDTGEYSLEEEFPEENITVDVEPVELEYDDFITIDESIYLNDIRDQYGIYSMSTYDLDQYLNDYGEFDEAMPYYTGRFAFPVLTCNDITGDLRLYRRDDESFGYYTVDSWGEDHDQHLDIYSGLYEYRYARDAYLDGYAGYEHLYELYVPGEGFTDVFYDIPYHDPGVNGMTIYDQNTILYYFHVGNFSIIYRYDGDLLSQEDLQVVIDSIHLTGEGYSREFKEATKLISVYKEDSHSDSSYDLDKYLNEDFILEHDEDWNDPILNEYTWRWVYPELLDCRFFTDVDVSDITDYCKIMYMSDSKTDTDLSITIYSGLERFYEQCDRYPQDESVSMITLPGRYGETDIIYGRSTTSSETSEIFYEFSVGHYSVHLLWGGNEKLTYEELLTIINGIQLVGKPYYEYGEDGLSYDGLVTFNSGIITTKTSDDLWQYLDSDGELIADVVNGEYTDRWAYPDIQKCRFYDAVELGGLDDKSLWFFGIDSETECAVMAEIYSGLWAYNEAANRYEYDIDSDGFFEKEIIKVDTDDGEIDVYQFVTNNGYDTDTNYSFYVGPFSVDIAWSEGPLSNEELTLIVNSFKLYK